MQEKYHSTDGCVAFNHLLNEIFLQINEQMIDFSANLWHDEPINHMEVATMEGTLGKRITANRKRLGLTQDQLAEKLGITAQAVSKWENDLSCPDISILPKLADIFEISIDQMLGHATPTPVCETTPVTQTQEEGSGFTYDSDSGKMALHWDGFKLHGICLACWVLLTGSVYLLAQLLHIDTSFWNVLWPSFLLTFGMFGLFPRLSVFRLGCALAGGYFLMSKLNLFAVTFDSNILISVITLMFGIALLADALRKSRHRSYASKYAKKFANVHHGKIQNDYNVEEDRFTYDASFGSNTQVVQLETLRSGNISTNFGEFIVDLTKIGAITENCSLHADCCFGELTILVPQYYTVIPDSSTSFASFTIIGQPNATPKGTIYLHADVSFGEIRMEYI